MTDFYQYILNVFYPKINKFLSTHIKPKITFKTNSINVILKFYLNLKTKCSRLFKELKKNFENLL